MMRCRNDEAIENGDGLSIITPPAGSSSHCKPIPPQPAVIWEKCPIEAFDLRGLVSSSPEMREHDAITRDLCIRVRFGLMGGDLG